MKLKKVATIFVCAAMATVFATSAFAKTTEEKRADAQAYLNANGISYDISAVTDAQIDALTGDKAELQAKADSLIAQLKADPSKAEALKNEAVAYIQSKGISVTNASISVGSDGTISMSATVNGTTASAVVAANQEGHGDIGEAIANGTWGKDEVSATTAAAAASLTGSTGAVVKATGDQAGMILLAGVLAAAGVLGMAVRKSSAVA